MTQSASQQILVTIKVAFGAVTSCIAILLWSLLIVSPFTSAAHGTFDAKQALPLSHFQTEDISQHISIYRPEPNDQITDIESLQRLSTLREKLPAVESNTKRYMAVLTVLNDTNESIWALDVYGTVIDRIDMTVITETSVQYETAGYTSQSGFPLTKARRFNIAPGQTAHIGLFIASDVFFSTPKLMLAPAQAFRTQQKGYYAIVIATLGALIALAIYNLFVFTGTKETASIYYALYLIVYSLAWLLDFGLGFSLLGLSDYRYYFIPFLLLPVLGGLFCIQFLQLDKKDEHYAHILKINACIALVFMPFSVSYYEYAKDITSIVLIVWITTAFIAGTKRAKEGFRPARYFSVAFLCLLIPFVLLIAKNYGLLKYSNINIEMVSLIGGLLDAILLAFALADRTAIISRTNAHLKQSLRQEVDKQTTQLSEANQQLEAANNELKRADDAKNQFLATVSHEIRTPLTSVIGFSEALMLGDVKPEQQNKVFASITNSSKHLLRIINDILDLSKIKENRLAFEYLDVDLFVFTHELFNSVEQRATDQNLRFNLNYEYPLPASIHTDPTRLKQILLNMTNNALKFTKNGHISISVSVDTGYLVFAIADTGIGLSEDEQIQIFSPFAQADISITRRFGGSGLGLSISRQLAQGLGGDIYVTSEKNKGSTFYLHIPADSKLSTLSVNSEKEKEHYLIEQSQITDTDHAPSFQARILIADDHVDNIALITLLLEKMHISVDVAYNGQQAVEMATQIEHYDLILMDINMPIVNGIQALKHIREKVIAVPIIALSATDVSTNNDSFLEYGFDDFISKPIDRNHFVKTISTFLEDDGSHSEPLLDDIAMENLRTNYIASLKQDLDKLRVAQAIGDYPTIKDIAHRIKGSASCFGFPDMTQQFSLIESQYKERQDDHSALEVAMRLIERL